LAWLAPLYRKCPEASQFYAVPVSESADDLAKDGIKDLLDISFIEMRMLSLEAQYQLGLDHGVRGGGGGGGGLGGLGGGGFGGRDIDYLFSLSCKVFTASSRS